MSRRDVLWLIAVVGTVLRPEPLRAGAPPEPRSEGELFRAIDRNRVSHLEFLWRPIRAQPDGEEAVQAVVAARFEELGLDVETLRLLPTRQSPELEFAAEETIDMTERVIVLGRLHRIRQKPAVRLGPGATAGGGGQDRQPRQRALPSRRPERV